MQGAGAGTQQDLTWELAVCVALLAALLSGRKCGNFGPWKLMFPSKHAGAQERLSRDPKPGRLPMSEPGLPAGKDPVVMASSRINFPRGSSFKGEVMSLTCRVPFSPLAAPHVPPGSQRVRGGPEPVPVPSPSWLSLDTERGHPSAQQCVLLSQLAPGGSMWGWHYCHSCAMCLDMPLVTWVSHRVFHS